MKVSIAMVTYNHEQFIAKAIESVLMQKVDFDYELVIGEDYSTDRTREIALEYQKKYPNKIRLLLSEQNRGARHNFLRVQNNCIGENIALLDGDDYWISANKLQRQVDFLESHRECSICFHATTSLREDESTITYYPPGKRKIYKLEELLSYGNFMAACSTLFRKGLFDEFPDWFHADDQVHGDMTLHILNGQHGKIGYINEVMAVYRVHGTAAWSSINDIERLKTQIQIDHTLERVLSLRYQKFVNRGISRKNFQLARIYMRNGNKKRARKHFEKSFSLVTLGPSILTRELYLAIMEIYLPRLFSFLDMGKNRLVLRRQRLSAGSSDS